VKDAQKPDHISLTTLITRLKEGRFVIPDFQREFEWRPGDVRELMRSIFLDYYIGSLLLWKGKKENFDALACEKLYAYNGDGKPEHIVLDGQQRLTAIYYAFVAPNKNLPNRSNRYLFFIHVDQFMEQAYDKAFEYDWTQAAAKLIDDPESQYQRHVFPLSVVGKGGWTLGNWVQDYEKFWSNRAAEAKKAKDSIAAEAAIRFVENAKKFGQQLQEITEQYQIAYIELDRDLELDKICDIFTQINTKGIPLDVFDIMNALLKPKGVQLKSLWRKASSKLDFVDSEKMNVYVLQVMSILKQAYCSPKYLYYLLPGQERVVRDAAGPLRKEILVKSSAEFKDLWQQGVDALKRAVDLLKHPQEFGAISSEYLPYISILPAFSALQTQVQTLQANRQLDAQRKIRHWYWASVFTNRYSGSVESTTSRDFLDVKAWFEDDKAAPALLEEFRTRFRSLDLHKELKKGTSVYNGIFNVLVMKGARDWMTGKVPMYDELDDHHIVPKDWGKESGLGSAIDTILNRTPLTADTNRKVIGKKLPNQYLPGLIKENGEKAVRATLSTHYISPDAFDILLRDPFKVADFEAFLDERQKTLFEAIGNLLIKEEMDFEPELSELDERIEKVELRLRKIIEDELNGDSQSLPPHIQQKVKERLEAAAAKDANFDGKHYRALTGILEYCDLRELQGSLTSKALWPLFEPRFKNKVTLDAKFDQLAELRNAIRHSRRVDEVKRKEGEAAILWFGKVLQK
jgi:hypothetical protein